MNFLPIVERELRVAARRPATYRIRVLMALLPIGVAVFMGFLFSLSNKSPSQMGQWLFIGMSVVAWYCTLGGAIVTMDCISSEKREGTLGLLFLTPLRSHDIVAGKVVAHGIRISVGMLAMVPVVLTPLLLGGVSWQEAARVTLTLGNTLFLSLCVGVFVSAMCRSQRAVAFWMAVCLLVIGESPVVGLVLGQKFGLNEPIWVLVVPSPTYAMFMSFDLSRMWLAKYGDYYWLSMFCTHLLGWLFLLLACHVLPKKWQDTGDGFSNKAGHGFLARLKYGSPETRLRHRRTGLAINPIYWLATRGTAGARFSWIISATGFVVFLLWASWNGFFWLDVWSAVLFVFFFKVGGLKTGVAVGAGLPVMMGRKDGTLELLLTTPVTTQEFVQGLFRAARDQDVGSLCFMLLADVLLWLTGRSQSGATGVWDLLWLSLVVLMFADLAPLRWAALMVVAKEKKPGALTFLAFLLVNGPPVLLVALIFVLKWLLTPAPLAGAFSWIGQWMDERLLVLLWLTVSLVWDWLVLVWARRWVLQNFRAALLEPPEPRRPGFGFWKFWERSSKSG